MQDEKRKILSVEVPETISVALENIIAIDTHANKSEFVREALREHIEKHAKKLGLSFTEVIKGKIKSQIEEEK